MTELGRTTRDDCWNVSLNRVKIDGGGGGSVAPSGKLLICSWKKFKKLTFHLVTICSIHICTRRVISFNWLLHVWLCRQQRAGIDLVCDEVTRELLKEEEVYEGALALLQRTKEHAVEQIRSGHKLDRFKDDVIWLGSRIVSSFKSHPMLAVFIKLMWRWKFSRNDSWKRDRICIFGLLGNLRTIYSIEFVSSSSITNCSPELPPKNPLANYA